MSLLLAEGHPNARFYPIAVLWSEARIARQRINAKMVMEATLLQTAVSTVLGGKKATKNFKDLIAKVERSD